MGKAVHRLSNIDTENKTALCAGCGIVDVVWKKHKNLWVCREALRAMERKRYYKEPRFTLRAEILESQNGACAVCKRTDQLYTLDHCHKTNYIRAVLCNSCNLAIGLLQDNSDIIREAASYIEYHEGRTDTRIPFK